MIIINDGIQVFDSLKVISNECVDLDDPKKVFDDSKGLSIGILDFDNPKVYSNTSIFDGLLYQ